MQQPNTTELIATKRARSRVLGLLGIIVAFLGLAGTVFTPLAFEVQRPPPIKFSEAVVDIGVKIKDRIVKKEAPVPPQAKTDWKVVAAIIASALGFIGVALGVASWIRREDSRISSVAVAVGVAAIAFHYVVIAVGIAVFLFLFGLLFPLSG